MAPVLLLALLAQDPVPTARPAETAQPATRAETAPRPLGFASRRYAFRWDVLLPLDLDVDGLKLNSVFFNTREMKARWLGEASFGTRAQVEVTNASKTRRIPGFAVAVFDKDDHLLGVASGGTKLGYVDPGATETFDLNFTQVKERLPKGDHFVLSVELR